VRLYLKHMRMMGYCRRGTQLWAQRHGSDWSRFLREGIPEEELLKTGDAMAQKAIEVAREQG
jgi:hypothetical protein